MYAGTIPDVRGLGLMTAVCRSPVFHPMAAVEGKFTGRVRVDDGVNGLMGDLYTI